MPCMCGDYCCPSCGPAQGNYRCPICNEWASDGCSHISEETGELKPEFLEAAKKALEAEIENYEEYFKWQEEMEQTYGIPQEVN